MYRVVRLLYRILASIFLPRRLWSRMGRDLLHTFDTVLEEACREGDRNLFLIYLSEFSDLIRGAFQLRFGVHRARHTPQPQFGLRTSNTWSNVMEG